MTKGKELLQKIYSKVSEQITVELADDFKFNIELPELDFISLSQFVNDCVHEIPTDLDNFILEYLGHEIYVSCKKKETEKTINID
jgi:hypothetical protein